MTQFDITGLSGLELLALTRGQDEAGTAAPSIRSLLGMRFDQIDPGRVVMSLRTRPDFANPQGTVHGGICATLLDSVMGCAVHSTLAAGVGYTTLELKVNYIRPGRLDGHVLIATGTVIHAGRTTATAEGRVVDEAGKLVAHATTTCLIFGTGAPA